MLTTKVSSSADMTELKILSESCQPIFTGSFAGVCYLYGEAGQGKSRLVYELEAATW
jgi:hypothetical protein